LFPIDIFYQEKEAGQKACLFVQNLQAQRIMCHRVKTHTDKITVECRIPAILNDLERTPMINLVLSVSSAQ
jgi:hypothetical protein